MTHCFEKDTEAIPVRTAGAREVPSPVTSPVLAATPIIDAVAPGTLLPHNDNGCGHVAACHVHHQ